MGAKTAAVRLSTTAAEGTTDRCDIRENSRFEEDRLSKCMEQKCFFTEACLSLRRRFDRAECSHVASGLCSSVIEQRLIAGKTRTEKLIAEKQAAMETARKANKSVRYGLKLRQDAVPRLDGENAVLPEPWKAVLT